jgi:transposase
VNDNARLHRIRLVLETLDLHEIQHFQLPARSPDLNPIEPADYLELKQKLFVLI